VADVRTSSPLPIPTFATAGESVNFMPDRTPAMPDEPPPPKDFAALYRTTIAPLRRYLARLLGNTSEAQDIAHDAYIRVYPSITKDTTEKPEALLYTTARRLAINRLKRRSIAPFSREEAKTDQAASAGPGVAQQVMARQEMQLLQEAIAGLPEGCRTVLLLRKVELLSHREIADRLGIAISTVEKQHARALRLLRAALPPETAPGSVPPAPAADTEARP
jgi:RNA polymerase sigma-70 factor (ECF subfamily)